LRLKPQETEFDRGIRHFGYLLTEVTLILVVVIFGNTVYLHRPVIDSFLFALAIAVGIIPELLPAIISINLAVGAVHMARRKVIVKQLASIENLGSMNVLCADKTGTLTEAVVKVRAAIDASGNPSEKTLFYAYLNSFYETGFANPIDEAIRQHRKFDINGYDKLDEIPYDFARRRLSVLVGTKETNLMITKGAVTSVLDLCSSVELPGGLFEIGSVRPKIEEQFKSLGADGFRTLALAYKEVGKASRINIENESELTFIGLLAFYDPPKAGVAEALNDLKKLGISLKVITGDSRHVATSVTRSVLGFAPNVLTGNELKLMSSEAIRSRANAIDVFAEIEPAQKERIILALKKAGNTVGFLGDGINDAAALHSADVGISVNTAVAVAKDAATLVLLEKDLGVLAAGVREGRKTFANTLKYVYMTTSANFGNMFSMAGAALLLPFLPLLPKQILLNNFLTDFPAMAISADSVDPESIETPRRWDIGFIRDFMIVFGIVSSFFDFLTFATLLFVLRATQDEFRTGWFLESVMTEIVIIAVMRTWKPFYRSVPGRSLMIAMIVVLIGTLALPYSPLRGLIGLTPLPLSSVLLLSLITLAYAGASEVAKRFFYSRYFRKTTGGPRENSFSEVDSIHLSKLSQPPTSSAGFPN
jgi:Mg2+-importing ATPase